MPLASIGFVSLGCAKNLVDSEIMAAHLVAAGWRLAPAPERADIVIVNTCSFIRDAKKESLDAIFEACSWKRRGPCRAVIVAGCLAQRYRLELPAAMPEVDAWLGLDDIVRIDAIVRRLAEGERGFVSISPAARAIIEPPPNRALFTGAPVAYLKIAEGCHHRCGFCAIPSIRGNYRSRPVTSILAEAENLLAHGIRELSLISQDVTSYGRDLGAAADLPRLLRALGAIGGVFWIRLLYGHPAHVTDALLDAMGEVSQVCHYLDMPVQHSHPTILRSMARPAVPGGLRRLVRHIRATLPDVVLRTTCLVGYPGETGVHFRRLAEFVEESQFEHLGVFAYSREEGTPAAILPAQVPQREANRRRDRLMLLQQKIVLNKAAARVGHTDDILVEKSDPRKHDTWIGRSRREAPEVDGVVFLKTRVPSVKPGVFIKARYVAAAGYDMKAVPAGMNS
jgi:ribosomal protein S12 methylthiotransferase